MHRRYGVVRRALAVLTLTVLLALPAAAGAPSGVGLQPGSDATSGNALEGLVLSAPVLRRPGSSSVVVWKRPLSVADLDAAHAAAWQTIVFDNFEGSFPGDWILGDGNAQGGEHFWDQSPCRAYSGQYSLWAAGGGADGSSLACGSDYADNMESWLIYGPFSLQDATAAELTWKLWLNSELEYDLILWGASIDGEEFWLTGASGDSDGWIDWTFDLNEVYELGSVLGQPNVWVALLFASDADVQLAEGCYVDDVLLRKQVGGVAQHRILLPIVTRG